ncbi:DUF1542 domain-containing protein [Convivina praedatoris]|uniref:Uncharacterized protein n=1 Tax=Convivina praedatoris TaxID=2880963 RepID=A0ABM9D200_9LACO|nr:DUF1542 domain-containing protein [Convivina sp. LMG 32447]CAH1853469.1 hypothetical protein R077815_00849 [Convivina sp. LMG 32447]CAH1854891.1 hypothetical protein LMG032447_00963 [Convivina sp. LMG 32447]CAH1854921.1 hypothetical protein R078138_01017 [Convivina sp. LMG 32447]
MSDQPIRDYYGSGNISPLVDDDLLAASILSPNIRYKQAAQLALIKKQQKIAEAIKTDLTLTDRQKQAQMAALSQELGQAKLALFRANSWSAIQRIMQRADLAMAQQHAIGLALKLQKRQAQASIRQSSQQLFLKINNDTSLSRTDKNQQQEKIRIEERKANQIIDQAQDAQQIANGKNMGLFKIKHQASLLTNFSQPDSFGLPKPFSLEQWRADLKGFFEKEN